MAKKFSGRYNLNDQARLNAVGKSSEQTVWTKNDKTRAVDCLVIAGGGGGGDGYANYSGGGGGGGGFRQSQVMITPGITYTVIIGTGGAGGSPNGTPGNPSQFGPIVSNGGGGGSYYNQNGTYGGSCGGAGGFGGKAYGLNSPSSGNAGVFPGDQGFIGQAAFPGNRGGGGGGNYKLQDSNWFTYSLGGHTGGLSFITGTQQFYGGGGGSGDTNLASGNNAGGTGGGGIGGTAPSRGGKNGSQNTGGGGGGAYSAGDTNTGGTGGSGIVIISYPDIYADPVSVTGTYNTANTGNGFKVYTWTATGSITF